MKKDIALWPVIGTTQYEQPIASGFGGAFVEGYEAAAQQAIVSLLNTQGKVIPNREPNSSPFIATIRQTGTSNEWIVTAVFNGSVNMVLRNLSLRNFESTYKIDSIELINITAQTDHFDMDVKVKFLDGTEIEKTISVFVD